MKEISINPREYLLGLLKTKTYLFSLVDKWVVNRELNIYSCLKIVDEETYYNLDMNLIGFIEIRIMNSPDKLLTVVCSLGGTNGSDYSFRFIDISHEVVDTIIPMIISWVDSKTSNNFNGEEFIEFVLQNGASY